MKDRSLNFIDRRYINAMLIVAAGVLVWAMGVARAQQQRYAVAKDGNDAHDCQTANTACLTVQGAVKKIPWGSVGVIQVGAGVYDIGSSTDPAIDIAHRTFVYIAGDCSNYSAVTLRGAAPGAIVWVQDRTTAIVSCLTMEAAPGVQGVSGLSTRQFVIADCNRVRFGAMPGGTHLSTSETSKLSCANYEIAGGAAVHAHVGIKSTITLGHQILVSAPSDFAAAFAIVGCGGDLDGSSAVFSGPQIGGKEFIVRGGQIYRPTEGFPTTQPGEDAGDCPRVN